jgi:hypothetical protein
MSKFLAEDGLGEKFFCPALNARDGKLGKAAALPYQMSVGRRCRAAKTSTARLFPGVIEVE